MWLWGEAPRCGGAVLIAPDIDVQMQGLVIFEMVS
jgi:hypothetical protein